MLVLREKFIVSKKLYAFNFDTFEVHERSIVNQKGENVVIYECSIEAVWFSKRNNGLVAAFSGTVSDSFSSWREKLENPPTLEFFLENWDGRYGGKPYGCWDGEGTWWNGEYSSSLLLQQQLIPFLQNMLENVGEVPLGYTGWYINIPT